jgi:hypothetical protein
MQAKPHKIKRFQRFLFPSVTELLFGGLSAL